MIGSIIGGALSLGTTLYGGWKASQASQQAKNINQQWYDRNYYEDSTQRADAQRMINLTRDNLMRSNRAARGRSAVMGGTNEGVAATQQANALAMADTASQIAANAERNKQAIDQQYVATQAGIEQQRAANIAAATGAAATAVGRAGQSVDEYRAELLKGGK